MPNWCNNLVCFTCPSKEMYDKLLLSLQENEWFQTFAPLGTDVKHYSVYNSDFDYDYIIACETWGTKWTPRNIEISKEDENNFSIDLTCETAWSPPKGVYLIMNKIFNIDVIAFYDEPNQCYFGKCTYINDESEESEKIQINEDYYYPCNIKELEELRNAIGVGSDLDDFMTNVWEELEEEWENEENEEDDSD